MKLLHILLVLVIVSPLVFSDELLNISPEEKKLLETVLLLKRNAVKATPQKDYIPGYQVGFPGYYPTGGYGVPGFQPWSGSGFQYPAQLLGGLFSGNAWPYPFEWLGGGGAYIGGYSGAVPYGWKDYTPNGKYIGGGNWSGYLAGAFPPTGAATTTTTGNKQ